MEYKIVELSLEDGEGNLLERKFEVRKRFLRFFWRRLEILPNQKQATTVVLNLMTIDKKTKGKWTEKEVDLDLSKVMRPQEIGTAKKAGPTNSIFNDSSHKTHIGK